MSEPIAARCLLCSSEFTEQEIENIDCCPNCKTKSIPLHPKNDVTIKINVHELRILGIWAERYAQINDEKHVGEEGYEMMATAINTIAKRIEEQLEPATWAPLTFSRELIDVKENFPNSKVVVIEDGKEREL